MGWNQVMLNGAGNLGIILTLVEGSKMDLLTQHLVKRGRVVL